MSTSPPRRRRRFLIVAMTVQETQIGEIRGPSGVAVVGLHLVPVRKQQPTPGAGSTLALEENGCPPASKGWCRRRCAQ
jgi:hypothetical protein